MRITTTQRWISIAAAALLASVSCKADGEGNDEAADSGESGGTGGGDFVFATDPPTAYTRVDRNGMPAVNTAVIPMARKDEYNAADPADDAAGTFVADITASVTGLHVDADGNPVLDDDLMGLGLTPCEPMVCVMQAAPLVVPDAIAINPAMPAGFPNGRQPTDPVIDVTLAVLLLDLSVHPADTLAGVPVNPPANDKEFLATFPYFAEPHTL